MIVTINYLILEIAYKSISIVELKIASNQTVM